MLPDFSVVLCIPVVLLTIILSLAFDSWWLQKRIIFFFLRRGLRFRCSGQNIWMTLKNSGFSVRLIKNTVRYHASEWHTIFSIHDIRILGTHVVSNSVLRSLFENLWVRIPQQLQKRLKSSVLVSLRFMTMAGASYAKRTASASQNSLTLTYCDCTPHSGTKKTSWRLIRCNLKRAGYCKAYVACNLPPNDLRLHNHPSLSHAVDECDGGSVTPLLIFDLRCYDKTSFGFEKTGYYRANFLVHSVANLREWLK